MTGRMVVESGTVDNLIAWYNRATAEQLRDGLAFYHDAYAFCESVTRLTGIDTRIVAAVLSALSPRNKWVRNMADCQALCFAYANGGRAEDVTVCTFNTNRAKAWRFLQEHTWANGPKTTAFVDNIAHHLTSDRVTVDAWAVRAYVNDPTLEVPSLTDKQYAAIEADYITAANMVGCRPMLFQSVVWHVIRESGKGE